MATEILTQVPGNMWKVLVSVGDEVSAGQVLFIMEVMKTEVSHEAPVDGRVTAVHVHAGQEGIDADIAAVVLEPLD